MLAGTVAGPAANVEHGVAARTVSGTISATSARRQVSRLYLLFHGSP
jgi:hypothetical protein